MGEFPRETHDRRTGGQVARCSGADPCARVRHQRANLATTAPTILTVPALGPATPYEVVTSALDAASKVLSEVTTTGVTVLSGSDQSLQPNCPAPLTITTTSLPVGMVGTAYSGQLAASGRNAGGDCIGVSGFTFSTECIGQDWLGRLTGSTFTGTWIP